jgi:putative membrane protein
VLGTAAATPGLWHWSLDLPLVLLVSLGILYMLGNGRTAAPARTKVERRLRGVSFYAGLAVLVIALNSPLDALSERLFWAHMVQHVLLLVVAPPLMVLARPWVRLWRSLGLGARLSLGRSLAVGERLAPVRWTSRALGRPLPSFVLFSVVLLAWHVPVLFDATLRSVALHALEHTLFFGTSLMFWKQVIHSPPLHARLAPAERVGYVIGAMVVSWVLAVVLALAPHPLYDVYAHQASRPGDISAMADQQLAAGIMWVPGSITFFIVIFVYLHRWLMPPAPGSTRAPRLASDH